MVLYEIIGGLVILGLIALGVTAAVKYLERKERAE